MVNMTLNIRYEVVLYIYIYYDYVLHNIILSFASEMNFHLGKQQKSPIKLVKYVGELRVSKVWTGN